MAAGEGRLMFNVTWDWIALYEPALDVANTVGVEKSVEQDLLMLEGEYTRWAAAAARSPELTNEETAAIAVARRDLLKIRPHIRAVLKATAAGEPLPAAAVATLNKASRAAPHWTGIGPDGQLEEHAQGSAVERLLAKYARSAMAIAAEGDVKLRVCGAPSCGMFFHPRRHEQRWCSEPCGNRARFARHYARQRAA
jgi:predicted RNA-binding Zn ribbon-like protein